MYKCQSAWISLKKTLNDDHSACSCWLNLLFILSFLSFSLTRNALYFTGILATHEMPVSHFTPLHPHLIPSWFIYILKLSFSRKEWNKYSVGHYKETGSDVINQQEMMSLIFKNFIWLLLLFCFHTSVYLPFCKMMLVFYVKCVLNSCIV